MEGKTMIEEIKLLLGDSAHNYSDAQISLAMKLALAEVEAYCNRDADSVLELCAEKIAVVKLLRMNTEGLASQSFSGVSENYLDGYPEDIQMILRGKRKLRVV
jgi:hypothetical protein